MHTHRLAHIGVRFCFLLLWVLALTLTCLPSGAIWKRAIGNHLGLTSPQFEQLCVPADGEDERSVSLDLIRHDLPRTFHRLELFVNPSESFSVDLVKVLEAFARLNGDLGYVQGEAGMGAVVPLREFDAHLWWVLFRQGMSYIGGMLLLNLSAFDAWVALNNMLVDNHFFVSLFRMNVPGIVQHARIYVSNHLLSLPV